ncbi:MAG TPA: TIR domain-containing protein [Blastocatellia bacterium]|nr:TIR domain-containing protein [Blastocatellia bacterium]
MGHVVITYEEQDFSAARELARELEIAGYGTWYRWRDGCVGPSFVGQCELRIKEAGALVAVISQRLDSPVTSSWLASDIETAGKCGTKVVTVIRGITQDEIIRRRSEWTDVAQSCEVVRLGSDGVRTMLQELTEALKRLGVQPYTREQLSAELQEKVDRYRLPAVVDVHDAIHDYDVARLMSREDAMKYKTIALENIGDVVVVAMSNPLVVDEIRDRCFPFSHGIEPVLASERAIIEAIDRVHRIVD